MNLSAFLHLPYDNYAYLTAKNEVEIRLRTGIEVDGVVLHYNDPYAWNEAGWIAQSKSMSLWGEGEQHRYFATRIQIPTHRVKYYFEIKSGEESIYFGEQGCAKTLPDDPFFSFFIPYFHDSMRPKTLEWVSQAQWYQIFPDRFCKGDNPLATQAFTPWDTPVVDNHQFYGGNLNGITKQLPYLQKLGINALYLTPIFKANTAHKYDTQDYAMIDPDFGSTADLVVLVEQAHNYGIRVILDAVFNHSGAQFAPWQDVLTHKEHSRYFDWFHVVSDQDTLTFETFADVPYMPKLNTSNPDVARYLIDTAVHWTKVANLDGWRLDVANEVDPQFWRAFRTAILEVNPDAYILGEIWHDAKPWLRGDMFDGTMNYPLGLLIHRLLVNKDHRYFIKRLADLNFAYPQTLLAMQFNLLDSHDTPRLYTTLQSIALVKVAYVLLFSMYGSPCIFYGSEMLMEGAQDPDCRRVMRFEGLNEQEQAFHAWMSQLQQLRSTQPAFGNEGILHLHPHPTLLHYSKHHPTQTLHFVYNLQPSAQPIELEGHCLFTQTPVGPTLMLETNQFMVVETKVGS
ncbi:MAG: glycoside hydrolase family 13 protein [Erysipelotrichaceae bacterium]